MTVRRGHPAGPLIGHWNWRAGFDWARANAIPKTADNAVDSAASLYMDIINLFLRILMILAGGRRGA